MAFYREGRADGNFDAGIGRALSAVLINPEFLFRVEADPEESYRAAVRIRITDLELASRLSFFLWSSIPDDELLDAAIRGRLSRPDELEKQTRRMLADRRSFNLATNFAGQWLRLRNLDAFIPSTRLFPDFDDNVRQGFRQETELFLDSIVREDRSVLDLIRADYTFLNERLAKHYGIPNVYGSRFRRVTLYAREQARRPAAPRQRACRHVVCNPHVAGYSWRVRPRQHLRRSATATATQRSGARREHGRREPADAREAGRAPQQRGMRKLPPDDRSGRIRARKLRRGRTMARL